MEEETHELQSITTVFAVLAVAVTISSACGRENDPSNRVSDALKQANIDDVRANYDSDSKVVHLRGNVETTAERERAEEIAEKAVGTSGKVLNEVTVDNVDSRSANDNDGQIRSQLTDMARSVAGVRDVANGLTVDPAVAKKSTSK